MLNKNILSKMDQSTFDEGEPYFFYMMTNFERKTMTNK